jgi:hypothetical protein
LRQAERCRPVRVRLRRMRSAASRAGLHAASVHRSHRARRALPAPSPRVGWKLPGPGRLPRLSSPPLTRSRVRGSLRRSVGPAGARPRSPRRRQPPYGINLRPGESLGNEKVDGV